MLLLIPCQPIFTFGISSLAVSGSAEDVCEINGVGFQTLGQALNAVSSGQTIKLLKNIEHNSGIEIIDKRITFDLNGFTLNVVNPVEEGETREISALYVVGDAGVELENEGEFNVTGKYGVFAAGIDDPTDSVTYHGTSVTVTAATGIGDDCIGLAAYNAEVTVKEDVATDGSYSYGIDANFEYAQVVVEGNVNVTGEQSVGVVANSRAIVTVDGSITVNGEQSYGIKAYDQGEATVLEDVTASGEYSTGIYSADAYIFVYGDVTGDAAGVNTLSSSIYISGNVRALNLREFCYGVNVEDYSSVYIGGNLESQAIGVLIPRLSSDDDLYVAIDGVIEAPYCYIQMVERFFDFEDGIPVYDADPEIMCYRAYEYKNSGVYVAMFAGGTGTAQDPYLISHAHQLFNVRCLLDKHFMLIEDIDLSGFANDSGWEHIGHQEVNFTGTFDGDMHTIGGLFIERSKSWNSRVPAGLFGYTGETAEIRNLILEDVDITGCYYVGGLTGVNNGNITNVSVSGHVKGEWDTGGLTGRNNGMISDSGFAGIVTGTDEIEYGDWTGGLAGYNTGTITDCQVDATVESEGKNIGGLVGESLETGSIIRSCSAGTVSGSDYTGGLTGTNSGDISQCYSMSSVEGNQYVGGLAGSNSGPISGSFAAGTVIGTDKTGGLVGNGDGETVSDSYWDTETSQQTSSDGGAGKTTAQMKQQETFVGWDFETVWNIDETGNYGYPFLRWQGQSEQPSVPPVLSETGAETGTVTSTTATLKFTSDKAGTYYYLVLAADSAAPDAAAVKAQGQAAAKGTGQAAAAANTVQITGLTASTSYKAYIIVEDESGNISNVAVISFSTANDQQPDDYISRTIINAATGITISGSIHKDAVLNINDANLHPEDTCDTCDTIRNYMADNSYITLLNKDISLSHSFMVSVTVSIPVGTQYNGKKVTILHCANGTLETFNVTVKDGDATFTLTGLSPIAVFAKADSDKPVDHPKTGYNDYTLWSGLLVCCALCGSVLLRRRSKRA
jgi:hypothetical protein